MRYKVHLLALAGFLAVAQIAQSQPVPTGLPAAAAPTSIHGKILASIVAGDVELTPKSGMPHKLIRGEQFEEGAVLRAMPGGSALLVFSNGATIKITENAQLMVTRYQQEAFDEKTEGSFLRLNKDPGKSITQLDLRNGTLVGEVKQLNIARGSNFTVDTPAGSVGIRGTILSLSVIRNAAGQVTGIIANCMIGSVVFIPTAVVTVTNAAGAKVTTATNGNPDVEVRTGSQMQLSVTVDPVTGAITGGGVVGANLGVNATNSLIQALYDTVNAARQLTGQPISPPQQVTAADITTTVVINNGSGQLQAVPTTTSSITVLPRVPDLPSPLLDPPELPYPSGDLYPVSTYDLQPINSNPSNASVD